MTTRLFDLHENLDTDDWYTPSWIFDALAIEFTIDVAAPQGGVPWIPASRHFTESDNGLEQQWEGTIWCNPPYSSPTRWADKLISHGDGLILVRADLSTGGYYRLWQTAEAMWVHHKRLQFVNGHSEGTGSNTFSTVMFSYGPDATKAMQRLGLAHGTTRVLR